MVDQTNRISCGRARVQKLLAVVTKCMKALLLFKKWPPLVQHDVSNSIVEALICCIECHEKMPVHQSVGRTSAQGSPRGNLCWCRVGKH